MGTYTARDRARAALVSLAEGTPDSVSFRHEAIAIVHRAIGVDGWGWLLTDPGARLPVHVSGENRRRGPGPAPLLPDAAAGLE